MLRKRTTNQMRVLQGFQFGLAQRKQKTMSKLEQMRKVVENVNSLSAAMRKLHADPSKQNQPDPAAAKKSAAALTKSLSWTKLPNLSKLVDDLQSEKKPPPSQTGNMASLKVPVIQQDYCSTLSNVIPSSKTLSIPIRRGIFYMEAIFSSGTH